MKAQIEHQLLSVLVAKHHRGHEGIGHRAPFIGEGHRHTGRLTNVRGLAKDHVEDGAVDCAVRRVHHDRADEFSGLAETIDAALPLLVACRVP